MNTTKKERLLLTYSNVRNNYEICNYLNRKENKIVVDNDPLLFRLRYLAFKDLLVEIDKIIAYRIKDKRAKIRHYEVLGLIVDEVVNSKLKDSQKIKLQVRLDKQFELIKTTTSIRDKCYAHLDESYKFYLKSGVDWRKLKKLIYFIEQTLIELYSEKEINQILNQIHSEEDYDLIERLF